jgi:hypothetical protein
MSDIKPQPIGVAGMAFSLWLFGCLLAQVGQNHDKVIECLKDNGHATYQRHLLWVDTFERCQK